METINNEDTWYATIRRKGMYKSTSSYYIFIPSK
jgi:hypothetical protein